MSGTGRMFGPVYRELLAAYGPQNWWPGDTPFEVMVGALLTQNTNWRNASRAIERLQASNLLDPVTILASDTEVLEEYLKPSGYYRVKTGRLRNLCRWLVDAGGVDALAARGTARLRSELLGINGVGPETADAILLYALGRPVFVVDAYAYRLFTRLGLIADGIARPSYEALRAMVQGELGGHERILNEFHALIVRHGKQPCRPTPHCDGCRLLRKCAYGKNLGWVAKGL